MVPLYEVLPPPCRLSAPAMASPQPMGSSTATGSQPAPNFAQSPVVIPRPSSEPLSDDVVDSKYGFITSVRYVAEKRKDSQAMSETASGGSSGQIGRRVVQRRGLMRMLSYVLPHHGDVWVITDDDVQ